LKRKESFIAPARQAVFCYLQRNVSIFFKGLICDTSRWRRVWVASKPHECRVYVALNFAVAGSDCGAGVPIARQIGAISVNLPERVDCSSYPQAF
jgi:hypothetical protein